MGRAPVRGAPADLNPVPLLSPRRLVAAVAALTVAAGACSKGEKRADPVAPGTTSATSTTAAPVLEFAISGVEANGTKAPDEVTVAAVKASIDRWLASAVVAPLHSGQLAGDLAPVFTPAALERLGDPAVRASLVDEGMPPASKEITAVTATAALSSVAGPDDVLAVVAAHLDLRLRAVGPSMDVEVVHVGQVVLVPEGDGWKIESFAMHTTRDSRGEPGS